MTLLCQAGLDANAMPWGSFSDMIRKIAKDIDRQASIFSTRLARSDVDFASHRINLLLVSPAAVPLTRWHRIPFENG